MGQRQNQEDIVHGNNCNIGFPPGETPKYLFARFSQIAKCPDPGPPFYETPPNDHVFKLTQHDIRPCIWEVTTTGWHVIIDLQSTPGTVIFWLEHMPDGRVYFFDTPVMTIEEGYTYNNLNRDCLLGKPAYGGIATVTWRLETLRIMEALNIKPAYNLFSEMFPLVDGNRVYKFCKRQYGMNIAIEYEPD